LLQVVVAVVPTEVVVVEQVDFVQLLLQLAVAEL
jgi:hypothetical protein